MTRGIDSTAGVRMLIVEVSTILTHPALSSVTSSHREVVTQHVVSQARAKLSPAAVSAKRKKIALVIAGLADLIQVGAFPIFAEGALSIPDGVLDGIVALLLLIVLGFRWRLLFSLALELVPAATLLPTWTAVVASLPTYPDDAAPKLPAPTSEI
jgi:hypothetical protein